MITSETQTHDDLHDSEKKETLVSPLAETLIEDSPLLEERLQEISLLKQALQDKQDEFLRAKAETENVRRRGIEERIKAQKFAIETFANDILPVVDAMNAALTNQDAPLDKVLEGVGMTQRLLANVLEKNAVKVINALGEKFDPERHQAIAMETSDGEAGRVIRVMQEGYLLQDRVLRPSMVIVSKAP